jgi:hypothetical protein
MGSAWLYSITIKTMYPQRINAEDNTTNQQLDIEEIEEIIELVDYNRKNKMIVIRENVKK